MRRQLLFVLICAAMAIFAARAQSPAPVVVATTSPVPVVSSTSKAAPAVNSVSMPLALKALQEIRLANEEMLKKQEAALQQLDELQKAADEVKFFSKRS